MKIQNYTQLRTKLLQWAATFECCAFLEDRLTKTIRLGVGIAQEFKTLGKLPQKEWLFGYIAYDYKNKLEDLDSRHSETISFDDIFFFSPQYVIVLTETDLFFEKGVENIAWVMREIEQITENKSVFSEVEIHPCLSKEEYLSKVTALQEHIQKGDIYEVNFCQEFVAEQAQINPITAYNELMEISPTPFAAFFKQGDKYALCSSPERYVKKEGNKIISQPIKGTAKRGGTLDEDKAQIKALENNPKERAENIMAVDVVRNDFARIAEPGTVEVDELCKVYTFQQWHQMISTVSATLPQDSNLNDVVKGTFPMASMTGAPKIRAMQLIEQYEESKRGLYSGTIGYVIPDGGFDLNVVIRTILYNAKDKKLSYTVGGAITAEATPEQEYEECLLKATAMRKILSKR